MLIKALFDTKIKLKPVDSNLEDLPDGEVFPVSAGLELLVFSPKPAPNGHTEVNLQGAAIGLGFSGQVFIFTAHWSGLAPELIITKAQAEDIFGTPISDGQLADLNSCLRRYEITTTIRLKHFLSQIAHESGGLQWLEEIWGPTEIQLGYEYRDDLGNFKPGDGYKFRGGGVIQLTGRYNYELFAEIIGDSEIVAQGASYVAKTYPFTSAGFWWANNKMNALCDSGASVETITRIVNGGINGLDDRWAYFDQATRVLG